MHKRHRNECMTIRAKAHCCITALVCMEPYWGQPVTYLRPLLYLCMPICINVNQWNMLPLKREEYLYRWSPLEPVSWQTETAQLHTQALSCMRTRYIYNVCWTECMHYFQLPSFGHLTNQYLAYPP